MSLWTVFKFLAGLCVLVVMAFTGMLAYHVVVRPLGGVFEKVIPNPAEVVGRQPDADFAKMLDSAELPDIDPGEKAFQKAHELLALGKTDEAREKLTTIVNVFPTSSSAPIARRIVGEMNLDEILSTTHMEGKKTHIVKRGNSFLGIAARIQNHPRSHHAPQRHDGAEKHPARRGTHRHAAGIPPPHRAAAQGAFHVGRRPLHPRISHPAPRRDPASCRPGKPKSARNPPSSNGHSVAPQSKDYRARKKSSRSPSPPSRSAAPPRAASDFPSGIVLLPQDMEEISLLTRVGNDVEIR